jgi:hypothetical protein
MFTNFAIPNWGTTVVGSHDFHGGFHGDFKESS